MDSFTARIPGDDRTGHFTQQAVDTLIGQTCVLSGSGSWDVPPDARVKVADATLDGTDVIVTFEVERGRVSESLAEALRPEPTVVSCGFTVKDAEAAKARDLSGIRLLHVWPGPAVPDVEAPR